MKKKCILVFVIVLGLILIFLSILGVKNYNIIKEIIPYLIHFLLKLFIREEKFMPAIIARAKITISNNLQGN